MNSPIHELRWFVLAAATALVCGAWLESDDERAVQFDDAQRAIIAKMTSLGAPPPDPTNAVADDPRAAQFGRRLFFDKRLSGDGKFACAHCHDPSRAFSDGKSLAQGAGQATRNAPTVLNAAFQRWQFWDGRADTLWSQALQPIENPLEMNGNRVAVARGIGADKALHAAYESIFGPLPEMDAWPIAARPEDGDTPLNRAWQSMTDAQRDAANRVFANAGKAIEAFERHQIGGDSPFDRFARGLATTDESLLASISPSAQRGLALFIGKAGCRACHTGPLLSDGEFHDLQLRPLAGGERTDPARLAGVERVQSDPFNAAGPYSDAREGAASEHLRYLARNPESWGAIRTPSLRNVALTPPYMDQGQLADLDAVLRFYSTREGAAPAGHHQEKVLQPLGLDPAEMMDLRAFLESLSDAPLPAQWRSPIE